MQQYRRKGIDKNTTISSHKSQQKMASRVSLEALAMAGANHLSLDVDFDEWERGDQMESPPSHLLADEEQEEEDENDRRDRDHHAKKIGIDNSCLQSKSASVDMKRCLNFWVKKVVIDASKYRVVDDDR